MCLLLTAWLTHRDYKLIIAANRDEFHDRPSEAAAQWPDQPEIYGGRDLQARGTWMAVNDRGHFSAVTNVRKTTRGGETSRGSLAVSYLNGALPLTNYLQQLVVSADDYDGYNFLACDGEQLGWFNNVSGDYADLRPGVYGLSNASLDTDWPKVRRIKHAYTQHATETGSTLISSLFSVLEDRQTAPDHALPETGVGLSAERRLSPIFINGPVYGTRCSTVFLLHREGHATFVERRFAPGQELLGETKHEFEITQPSP